MITREAKKQKGWLAGKQPDLKGGTTAHSKLPAYLPVGPKHGIKQELIPAQPNLNC